MDKQSKVFENLDEEITKLLKDKFSEYNQLLTKNRSIKEELNNLEKVTEETNMIYNTITNQLKDNRNILQDNSK